MSEQSKSLGKIILILVVAVIAIGGAWYFAVYKPEQEAKERARQEQIAQKETERKNKERAVRNKAKFEKLILDADAQMKEKQYANAQPLFKEASLLFPDEQYPKDQLALVNQKLEEIAAKGAGGVESVDTATGRYYIVVSSSVDDDLAMDYANQLAAEGTYVKVLAPPAGELFYRVTVGDHPTRKEAESAAKSYSNFGNQVWVLRY